MFRYVLSDFYWFYLFIAVFWVSVFIVISRLKKTLAKIGIKATPKQLLYLCSTAVSFSFFGMTMGLLVGQSLAPVVGVVIPALLTFLGGFMAYVFIFGRKRVFDGYTMIIILVSISLFLIVGADYGAAMRTEFTQQEQDFEYQRKKDFEILRYNLEQEDVQFEEGAPISDSANVEE
jgi:hypothetical protein